MSDERRRGQVPDHPARMYATELIHDRLDGKANPNGEFVVNVMGSAARWERRIISQRTRDALAIKRTQGVPRERPSTLAPQTVQGIVRERKAERR